MLKVKTKEEQGGRVDGCWMDLKRLMIFISGFFTEKMDYLSFEDKHRIQTGLD